MMARHNLLILLCHLVVQNAALVPLKNGVDDGLGIYGSQLQLTPSSPSISHFVNDSFIILCRTMVKDLNIKWLDPNGLPLQNLKGRVHIEKKTGHLALVFEHIFYQDKGNWSCGMDLTSEIRKSFELLVNEKISFARTELVQSVREGHDATVYCFARGEPVPDVSWLYNGEHINTINSLKHKRLSDGLFIKNVSQSDAGEYTCRGMRITPTFSDSDQITILLRIQHKPSWFYNETIFTQYAYIGGFVNLSCYAMSEPPPSFTWQHNGKAIVGHNHNFYYVDYGSILQLFVKNQTQFGDYKCKVNNPLGTLERIIKLRIGPKPLMPNVLQLRRIYANALELDIRSPKVVNVPDEMKIYGYNVQFMSETDLKYHAGNWSFAKQRDFLCNHSHRFVISHLNFNTTYYVRAASKNLAGVSDWCRVRAFVTQAASAACDAWRRFANQLWALVILMILTF